VTAAGGEPPREALLAEIARLEGRIAALESALTRRSRELRLLQRYLCPTDLVQLARIADGLPPLPKSAHQLEYWTETTEIAPANLESTLEDLWASLTPSPAAPPRSQSPRAPARAPFFSSFAEGPEDPAGSRE
jgi:hypothetical protein